MKQKYKLSQDLKLSRPEYNTATRKYCNYQLRQRWLIMFSPFEYVLVYVFVIMVKCSPGNTFWISLVYSNLVCFVQINSWHLRVTYIRLINYRTDIGKFILPALSQYQLNSSQ